MNFHETRMGAAFFNGQFPELVRQLKELNKNLAPKKKVQEVTYLRALPDYLSEGWYFVDSIVDGQEVLVVVEKEVG